MLTEYIIGSSVLWSRNVLDYDWTGETSNVLIQSYEKNCPYMLVTTFFFFWWWEGTQHACNFIVLSDEVQSASI